MLQTRRNAWTAFQTLACYSAFKDRASPFESSFHDSNLGHRGVTRTTVLVQVGAPYLRSALHAVKRALRRKLRRPSDRRFRRSTPGLLSRQADQRAFTRCSASRGAASIPTPGSPSRGRSGCPFRPLERGALCSPSEESRQGEHRLRCDSALQPLPTGALCSRDSIPCQAGAAERHDPHGASSRRHWAAALSARWSGRPASRARAAATISSSRSRATSTSSFSRTYS